MDIDFSTISFLIYGGDFGGVNLEFDDILHIDHSPSLKSNEKVYESLSRRAFN